MILLFLCPVFEVQTNLDQNTPKALKDYLQRISCAWAIFFRAWKVTIQGDEHGEKIKAWHTIDFDKRHWPNLPAGPIYPPPPYKDSILGKCEEIDVFLENVRKCVENKNQDIFYTIFHKIGSIADYVVVY